MQTVYTWFMCGRIVHAMDYNPKFFYHQNVYKYNTNELLPEDRQLEGVCADCGQPAKYVIYELNNDKWYYCGGCQIG